MFTSDKYGSEKMYTAVIGGYLAATVFCALFGAVYECFSHEVYSYFMIYAFAFPLMLGVIPFFLIRRAGWPFPYRAAALIHAGAAALTVGSIVQGILAIYGTENQLTAVYWISGAAISAAGWLTAGLRLCACFVTENVVSCQKKEQEGEASCRMR